MEEIQAGIYRHDGKLLTENAAPGDKVYGENLMEICGDEYREWILERSKAAAAVEKGLELGIEEEDEILYLGAASGTTVSHLSDIASEGFIVAVEYSETVARKLVEMAESRENIAPVIADARNPGEYGEFVKEADVVYQDVSQSDQAEILLKNCRRFLKDGGTALIAIKARSISNAEPAGEIFEEVLERLSEELTVIEKKKLEPFEKDHLFVKLEKEV
ncbi:MAG: fibrillarin-like rRNA/tRNA 2'-O-methyltransferase [Candidatus Nanohaloarchaea archaeon]